MAMSSDRRAQPSDVLRPKNVGAPIKRTEDPRLLTGNGEYTADRKPDRPLHLAFLRSGQPHAKIARQLGQVIVHRLTKQFAFVQAGDDDAYRDHRTISNFLQNQSAS